MSMHRDDDTRDLSSRRSSEVQPVELMISVFTRDWGPPYGGSFYVGTPEAIERLEGFCVEHEMSFDSSRAVHVDKARMVISGLFRGNPRGYLVLLDNQAVSGVRLLRLVHISTLGRKEFSLAVAIDGTESAPIKWEQLDSDWPVVGFEPTI